MLGINFYTTSLVKEKAVFPSKSLQYILYLQQTPMSTQQTGTASGAGFILEVGRPKRERESHCLSLSPSGCCEALNLNDCQTHILIFVTLQCRCIIFNDNHQIKWKSGLSFATRVCLMKTEITIYVTNYYRLHPQNSENLCPHNNRDALILCLLPSHGFGASTLSSLISA